MLNSAKQVEIAKLGMGAAIGYTRAAINATFETNTRALAMWSQAAQVLLPRPAPAQETWEWSGAPKRPHSTLLAAEQTNPPKPSTNPFAVWSEVLRSGQQAWFKGPPSPFAWWAWSPQSAVPSTWPWAYGMIASGVPDSVAWPVAEANQALLDAAKKTAEAAVPVTFPSYHSAGGFATAQVWMGSPLLKSLLVIAPAATVVWPWLERAV